ncbi:hypothetical protein [Paenibacillus sp. L3-i20]|uniref:hypothetical protein n=1 Tax=Paenibacillus sp. L3-i20 TaxID=2905833 RepID=UPI001EDEDF3E|nr:hypothetical protein [Paenibacillus sp. L3-i20]
MMKKSMISITLIIAIVLSFSTSVFAAFSYTSPFQTLSAGTIKFGNGVIVNTGKYRDDLKIDLYRGTTYITSKTITLNPGQSYYPDTPSSPAPFILATGQPAGQYRFVLSASGSFHVMSSLYN